MRYMKLAITMIVLNGCAHSELNSRICDGFQEWVAAPIGTNMKVLSFDWGIIDEESIPLYANMITHGLADEYDQKLYEKVAQATHYIELKEYSSIVANCLKLKKATNQDNRLAYFGQYHSKEVSVVWENKYCASEIIDNNGCFTITKK